MTDNTTTYAIVGAVAIAFLLLGANIVSGGRSLARGQVDGPPRHRRRSRRY